MLIGALDYNHQSNFPALIMVPYWYYELMPPKIRILEKQLIKAGFIYSAGKGSHRKYFHPIGGIVVITGKGSKDARPYQINMVRDAIALVGE